MRGEKSEPVISPLPYLIGAAIGAVGLGAAIPTGLAWAFLHPPRRLHNTNPRAAFGIPYERVRFRTEDGVTIRAWYVPAPVNIAPRAVVVVSHGYNGNRANMLPYLRFLHQAGYAALLYDFRAHGWSGGRMASFGSQEPLDLRAALDWIASTSETKSLPLLLLGESMGGAVSLLTAAEVPRVRAVVSDSAYARFDHAVAGRLESAFGPAVAETLGPHTQRAGERILGVRCADIAPVEAIVQIAPRPVLLIHGLRDRLVVPENARRLYEAAPGNAELWEIPEAPHVGSVYARGNEYGQRIVEFFDRALASEPTI